MPFEGFRNSITVTSCYIASHQGDYHFLMTIADFNMHHMQDVFLSDIRTASYRLKTPLEGDSPQPDLFWV